MHTFPAGLAFGKISTDSLSEIPSRADDDSGNPQVTETKVMTRDNPDIGQSHTCN